MATQITSITNMTGVLAAEEQKLLACIHCGLCLEACPTYVATGNENDGPRGRIYLMRAVAEGRLENTSSAFGTHIDRCLGCRACEQACPAGVAYGQLLEASREELLNAQPKTDWTSKLLRFALRNVWLSPARLRLFFGATRLFRNLGLARIMLKSGMARLISPRAEFAMALLESSRPIFQRRTKTEIKSNPSHETVLLFKGCVGEGLFARVNRATRRVLQANGYNVVAPEDQVCCGALHAHAGDLEGARELARKNLAAFDESKAPIITNAGGCGAMLTSYGHLLANDERFAEQARQFTARVRDVSQQLATREMRAGESPLDSDEYVACDLSCHLLYGQKAGDTSLKMVRSIRGLNFGELDGAERCCGAAGIYNLVQPELSSQVLKDKLHAVEASEASIVVTGNAGCQMQIGAGAKLGRMGVQVCHPIELVDESYVRAGFYDHGKQNA
ncbi:MAG TPA: heterodisulfide reductase-related iron-sulfur binding cluster [Pyrinomonadaceae bacterium]|nr:heterodisulfide reductase-related iron-sulfur binding cluster [Pyrinomonadaceae bacterium]